MRPISEPHPREYAAFLRYLREPLPRGRLSLEEIAHELAVVAATIREDLAREHWAARMRKQRARVAARRSAVGA